jgi:predicted nucleotidyltransferase
MVTIKNIERKIAGLLNALDENGFEPCRAILFGSYANGSATESSDLDLAIWAQGFSGNSLVDIEKVAPLLRPFHPIELHPFSANESADDNPFIEEIERTGKDYSYLLNVPV